MSDISFLDRLKHSWELFKIKNDEDQQKWLTSYAKNDFNVTGYYGLGPSSSRRLDRKRISPSSEQIIIGAIYTKIATDVAAITYRHVKVDDEGLYKETVRSSLNDCFAFSANIDQTGRELIFDAVLSMLDEGYVAMVPIETSVDIRDSNHFDILSLRVGKILEWYPKLVKVKLYDDISGDKKEIILPKEKIAIFENPFYSVMNQGNSLLKRLIRKLNLLDVVDDNNASSALNLILQLPYVVKSAAREQEAEERIARIEQQLNSSKYGIAYADSTEKITQVGRTLDNNITSEVEYLISMLYNQLGVTADVFNGTADEQVMLNYYNSTVEPIASTLTNEMTRKFLTKTARTQGQRIQFVKDPFRLVPVNNIAEIADKFTRNEIMSSNEMRTVIGLQPVEGERANELRNKNINQGADLETAPAVVKSEDNEERSSE